MIVGIIIGLVIGIPIGIAIISLCVMAKQSDVVHEKYSPPDNYCGEEAAQTITHPMASSEEIKKAKASITTSASFKQTNPNHIDNGGFEGFM